MLTCLMLKNCYVNYHRHLSRTSSSQFSTPVCLILLFSNLKENSVKLAKHTSPEDRLPSRSDAALVGSKVLPPQAQQLFLLQFCGPVCPEMSAISFP